MFILVLTTLWQRDLGEGMLNTSINQIFLAETKAYTRTVYIRHVGTVRRPQALTECVCV